MGFKTYTCPIARKCGGCEWLAVPYPIQLRRKQEAVEKLFSTVAQQDGATIESICGMDEPLAYRFKAATPFAQGKQGRIRSGFYAAGSHRIVACKECLVEDPRARDILHAVAHVGERLHIPAYNEDQGKGCLRHAVVRCGYATDDILLTVVTNGPNLPQEKRFVDALLDACPDLTSIVQNVNDRRTSMVLGAKNITLFGPGYLTDTLCGLSFKLSPASFFQVNPVMTEPLYETAVRFAGLSGKETVIDAYCGTGTIGLIAAGQAGRVIGAELNAAAVRDARENAAANGIRNAKFIKADAGDFMTALAGRGESADAVFLDPPRSGCSPAFLAACLKLSPSRIVYVSCGPESLARDLAVLTKGGYPVSAIQPFDLFPFAEHSETVCALSKLSEAEHHLGVHAERHSGTTQGGLSRD